MLRKIKHLWYTSRLIDKFWVGGLVIGSLVVLTGIFLSNETPAVIEDSQSIEPEEELMM